MSERPETTSKTEFCRIFEIGRLANGPVNWEITAGPRELEALTTRFGVEGLDAASANLSITSRSDGGFIVEGSVQASLTQNCVLSLEPIEEKISESIRVIYLPEDSSNTTPEAEIDPNLDEEFEIFYGDSVDLGEMISQQIAAAIDPYPRKHGTTFGNQAGLGDNDAEERDNPFAVLKQLKDRGGQAGSD